MKEKDLLCYLSIIQLEMRSRNPNTERFEGKEKTELGASLEELLGSDDEDKE